MSLENTLFSLSIFRRPGTVVKVFIIVQLITLNIQESSLRNVIEQNNV